MTLKPSYIKRKIQNLRNRHTEMEQQTYSDAWLLMHLIKQHSPDLKKLKDLSELGTMRFSRAWKLVKPKVWRVGNGYEQRTETAKL